MIFFEFSSFPLFQIINSINGPNYFFLMLSAVLQHLEINKNIQRKILEFLEHDSDTEENYQNLIQLIEENKIKEDEFKLQELLHLISIISSHHHRGLNFFSKIERILLNFTKEIKQSLSNSEIFHIFHNNKRIILFLIEENIIIPNKQIVKQKEYDISFLSYFCTNFNKLYNKYILQAIDLEVKKIGKLKIDVFDQKRKTGENDNYICQLIRNDSVEEFITYVNKNDYFLSSKVEDSIFETNQFLIENKPLLIEYSAFFGSTQIFKYLYLNGCKLTPSLWIYSIHGNDPEIINILEENEIKPQDESYIECYNESIKCHHIDMTEYILKKILDNKSENDLVQISKSIKYYNFIYFPKDINCIFAFQKFCRYNYYTFVKFLIENKNIDVNETCKILIKMFLYSQNSFFSFESNFKINF